MQKVNLDGLGRTKNDIAVKLVKELFSVNNFLEVSLCFGNI